jgi:flagellar hook-length control protein FliK
MSAVQPIVEAIAASQSAPSANPIQAPVVKITATPAQPAAPQASATKPAIAVASQADVVKSVIQSPTTTPPVVETKTTPQMLSSAQPIVEAKAAPQAAQAAEPVQTAPQTQSSAPARDTKQDARERPSAPRETSAAPETQIQTAPATQAQPAQPADVKTVVQSVLAAQVSPAPAKATPQRAENTSARGSMAAAFAAAAARSAAPVQATPAEPRTTTAPVGDKPSVDAKDSTQSQKNSDTAPAKNDSVAPAPVALNDTAQVPAQLQTADNTIQLPQSAVTLTNDPNAAVTQAMATQPAPHLTANISASLQVGPKDQAAPAHAQQADLSAFAINIVAKSQAGLKHFDIRLDPAEMGRVEVRLSIDESGKATAHLSAEKPQTLDLLQRDSTTLERTLKESGLDLSQNGLNFSLKGQNQQHNGSDAQPRGTPLAVTAIAEPEPSINPINLRADNVRLDIHV